MRWKAPRADDATQLCKVGQDRACRLCRCPIRSSCLWETGTLLRIVLYEPANQRSGSIIELNNRRMKWLLPILRTWMWMRCWGCVPMWTDYLQKGVVICSGRSRFSVGRGQAARASGRRRGARERAEGQECPAEVPRAGRRDVGRPGRDAAVAERARERGSFDRGVFDRAQGPQARCRSREDGQPWWKISSKTGI